MCKGKTKDIFRKLASRGPIERQKPPDAAATGVFAQRIEGPDTQSFVGASGAPGIFGKIATIMGMPITSQQNVTRAGDVSSGRIGKAYGAADLRISRPNLFGGAPTGNPNGPPIPTIPRPIPDAATAPPTTTAGAVPKPPRSWNLTEAIRRVTMAANSATAARTLFGSRG